MTKNDTLTLPTALENREEAWEALYNGAMAGCRAHRATGSRTAEARKARKGLALPLPAHVDEATGHDGFVDAALKVPSALRYAPTGGTARRIVGSATAFQARVAVRPAMAAPGVPQRSKPTPLAKAHTVRELAAKGWEADPALRLETLEEAAAILASLPEADRETLRRHREGEGAPEGVKPAAWRKRLSRARDAARAAVADRA